MWLANHSRLLRALGMGVAALCLVSSGGAALGTVCEMGEGCPMTSEAGLPPCHQQGQDVSAAIDCCAYEGEASLPEPPAIGVSASKEQALPARIGSTGSDLRSAAPGRREAPRSRPPWEARALFTLHSAYLI